MRETWWIVDLKLALALALIAAVAAVAALTAVVLVSFDRQAVDALSCPADMTCYTLIDGTLVKDSR